MLFLQLSGVSVVMEVFAERTLKQRDTVCVHSMALLMHGFPEVNAH